MTSIHDYAAVGRNRLNSETASEEQPAAPRRDENRSLRRQDPAEKEAKHPHKRSPSPSESSGRGNFYPITWRVIGGGVLMGGPRDVCQAYLAGGCKNGLDCKFSHPSAADELEHAVAFSPPLEPYYPPVDQWSPISPLYINPFVAAQMVPPSPVTEDGYDDSPKALTIDTLVARPAAQYFPARVVLDGNTLTPRDSIFSDTYNLTEDNASLPPNSRSPSPEPSPADDVGARNIVRPVSTPPYTSSTFSKVVRLFAAEMP
ncbi:hypothetical protein NM688_g7615 [Phlebia brevispora]|uniref:Uncharacterized protein n=1 Tax=Phlebia brevispora TaxID=194682 RepID=A0ACC1S3F6_9APHY|nr:hypothetical protein NM688_g7615 [Phlebia brevispora]